MKTIEYVRKYNLSQSNKFDHSEFVSDLTIDFLTLLEVGNATNNLKGFNNAANAIRMKFDAINNKTVGCIPETLWNYFYATVVAQFREKLFPKEMDKIRQQKAAKKRAYEQRLKWEEEQSHMFNDWFFASAMSAFFKARLPEQSFAMLGLTAHATEDDVKAAYRSLCLKCHPDKGGSTEKFTEITEAKNKCLAYIINQKP